MCILYSFHQLKFNAFSPEIKINEIKLNRDLWNYYDEVCIMSNYKLMWIFALFPMEIFQVQEYATND